jgi:hypothetical protein
VIHDDTGDADALSDVGRQLQVAGRIDNPDRRGIFLRNPDFQLRDFGAFSPKVS